MVPPENFAEQVERQKEKPKLDRKKKMLKMDNLEFGSSCCCCEEVGEETTQPSEVILGDAKSN